MHLEYGIHEVYDVYDISERIYKRILLYRTRKYYWNKPSELDLIHPAVYVRNW